MGEGLTRRALGFVAAFVLVGAPLPVATAAFASDPSAQSTASVATGAQLRAAWEDESVTAITLTADISLGQAPDTCADAHRLAGGTGIVVDGQGLFGITQTCNFDRILLDEGVEHVTLTGLTHFDGGKACGAGGGLYANGAVTVENSSVAGNEAIGVGACAGSADVGSQAIETDPVGGGVHSDLGGTTITNSSFTNNHADLAGGGVASVLDISVTGSSFTGNAAGLSGTPSGDTDFSGGGFATLGNATVSGSSLIENHFGDDGGTCSGCGVSGGGFWAVGTATVSSTTFEANLADCEAECSGFGGGFTSFEGATLDGSSFTDNNAGCDGLCFAAGGALLTTSVQVTGSTFEQNVTGCSGECDNVGGGIFADDAA
jgi:hypothetical protein